MFCTITPTRGDRPELLEFCKHQLKRMSVKPDKSYFIDYKPVNGKPDLTERVRKGVEMAKRDGFDTVFIIEDDDYYSPFYFTKLRLWANHQAGFMGMQSTIYYHIGKKKYNELHHPGRSSLFTTAFKISAVEKFNWQRADPVFLDLNLWTHAKKSIIQIIPSEVMIPAIGIKHGIGLCGGSGHHKMKYENDDSQMEFLRRHVDPDAIDFYQSLNKKL